MFLFIYCLGKRETPLSTIPQVVETLQEGFRKNEETRVLLKRKREFEEATHVLEWDNVERPVKIPRVVIRGFKDFYSFELLGPALLEVSRPGVKLRSEQRSPYYKVDKVVEISFRTSEIKEKRKTKRSTFNKKRRQEVIQERREISPSLSC